MKWQFTGWLGVFMVCALLIAPVPSVSAQEAAPILLINFEQESNKFAVAPLVLEAGDTVLLLY